MVTPNFRSTQLRKLFDEVWAALPARRRAALDHRCVLVTDARQFFSPAQQQAFCALSVLTYRKSIYLFYLNRARLAAEPAGFAKDLILRGLARVLRERAPQPA